jgi:hypothetical protein
MSGAMRRIEDELTEGHEVLTHEPAPVLIGSGWLRPKPHREFSVDNGIRREFVL